MSKIAFIKFAGMANSGIEKYLQTLAILLKKEGHDIDFYYTNAAPFSNNWVHPDNSEERIKLCKDAGINLIPVHVKQKNGHNIPYEWIGSNIFDLFDENKYDYMTTGRSGYSEFPFNVINKCPIIDTIHSFIGEDKPNIKKVILLSEWQALKWGANGGNINKSIIIPSLVYIPPTYKNPSTLRKDLNIPEDKFVFGLFQSNRTDIFSPISLLAYSKVENKNNCFLMLGGSELHRKQAQELKLKNVYFLDATSDINKIHNYLEDIDCMAHSRADGEVCSACIIEAQAHGKPVITHHALNDGQVEQVDGCGRVAKSLDDYVNEMMLLQQSKDYYQNKSELTLERYNEKYRYDIVEKQFKELYIN